jgi:anaphase-promoting complex subunit 1
MWDLVEDGVHTAADDWIDSQVPPVVTRTLFDKLGPVGKFDEIAAFPVYLSIITGYCFGISLVFAGTADTRAKQLILIKLRLLQSIRDQKHRVLSAVKFRSFRATVEMCLSSVALSLATVLAGTGDLDSFRILRELRWKHDEGSFGYHLRYMCYKQHSHI